MMLLIPENIQVQQNLLDNQCILSNNVPGIQMYHLPPAEMDVLVEVTIQVTIFVVMGNFFALYAC